MSKKYYVVDGKAIVMNQHEAALYDSAWAIEQETVDAANIDMDRHGLHPFLSKSISRKTTQGWVVDIVQERSAMIRSTALELYKLGLVRSEFVLQLTKDIEARFEKTSRAMFEVACNKEN